LSRTGTFKDSDGAARVVLGLLRAEKGRIIVLVLDIRGLFIVELLRLASTLERRLDRHGCSSGRLVRDDVQAEGKGWFLDDRLFVYLRLGVAIEPGLKDFCHAYSDNILVPRWK